MSKVPNLLNRYMKSGTIDMLNCEDRVKMFKDNIINIVINDIPIDLSKSSIEFKKYRYTDKKIGMITYENKYNLYINDIKPKMKDKFYIEFYCPMCHNINHFKSYKKFLYRLNKDGGEYCSHCVQKLDVYGYNEKRKEQLKGRKYQKGFSFSMKDDVVKNDKIFDNLSLEYKNSYWETHFTKEEWNDFIDNYNVYSINDYKLSENEIEYIPYVPVPNQNMFSSAIKVNDSIETIKEIKLFCKVCGNPYTIHHHKKDILNKKTKNICKDCCTTSYFYNTIWSVKSYKNIENNEILYQSQFELDFINWCNSNNIIIENGPSIDYFWNGKDHTYRIDFYIPKLNWLIELKANHQFHREQLSNGRWESKENAAKEFVENGIFSNFILLYDYEYTDEWKNNFLSEYNK